MNEKWDDWIKRYFQWVDILKVECGFRKINEWSFISIVLIFQYLKVGLMIKQLDSMLPAQFVPWSTFTARGSYTEISNQKTWYWVHFSFSWKFKQIQIQITKDTWSWLTLDLLKESILDVKHGHFVEHLSMLLLRLFLTR